MNATKYIGSELHGYPHGEGVIIEDDLIIEGTWEKGKRINYGAYKYKDMTIKCKYKNGKIFKFLEFRMAQDINVCGEICFPDVKYIQEGEFYREIEGDTRLVVFLNDKRFLFDGIPVKSRNLKTWNVNGIEIFAISDDKVGIRELEKLDFRIVGRIINLIPFGPVKIIRNENFYIKGLIRGYCFVGEVKIIQNNKRIFLKGNEGLKPMNIKIVLKDKNIEIKMNYEEQILSFTDQNSQRYSEKNRELIFNSLAESLSFYSIMIMEIDILCKKNSSIANSLMVTSSWLDLERMILKISRDMKDVFHLKDNFHNRRTNFKGKEDDLDKRERYGNHVVREKYVDGSFYYGEIYNGLRHGLGCFIFSNGDKYRGYFKMNRFCGQGSLQTSCFRIKGMWENCKLTKIYCFSYLD